jgi:2-iminobutanoate/2-iminopropanoate deaminase
MGKIINTENAPKPVGPYSQAVKAGEFLFISGQVAIDPKVGKITASDVKGQTERVMENVKAILAASGYGLKDIVQTNVYLTSITLFGDFNIVYAKYFDRDFPARATVGIALMPGALVEVSAVAYKEKE